MSGPAGSRQGDVISIPLPVPVATLTNYSANQECSFAFATKSKRARAHWRQWRWIQRLAARKLERKQSGEEGGGFSSFSARIWRPNMRSCASSKTSLAGRRRSAAACLLPAAFCLLIQLAACASVYCVATTTPANLNTRNLNGEELDDSNLTSSRIGAQLNAAALLRPQRGAAAAAENGQRQQRQQQQLKLGNFESAAQVRTKQGIFRGTRLTTVTGDNRSRTIKPQTDFTGSDVIGFLGIRYASAPIKRLRFMPPTAYHYPMNQVHNVQQFGPICRQRWPVELPTNLTLSFQQRRRHQREQSVSPSAQASGMSNKDTLASAGQLPNELVDIQLQLLKRTLSSSLFGYLRTLFKQLASREQSEDCLNLNVYSPIEAISGANSANPSQGEEEQQRQKSLLPVLVVVHGESFDFGSGSTIDPLKFVQQNRIIVVTFNYRLNILGFPPKIAGASRGNLGLMDQVAALHWIHDNIRSFGGSPSNVTLMGTKRGAIFVNLLMLSPLAKGLFQRALLEDGAALTPSVANHVISSVSPGTMAPTSAAVQHVRLLAKLCDCPVYQRPISSSTFATTTTNNNSIHSADNKGRNSHQQQILSNFADETKTNALTFECLRQKPVEQIMQRIPIDLLHFNSNQQLVITTRPLSSSSSQIAEQLRAASNGSDIVAVNAHQIQELVMQTASEELERGKLEISFGTNSSDQADEPPGELFGAIYMPSASNARPLFGPLVDGTIVPDDEDIAAQMLKQNSTFAQRDLMVGLSQPTIPISIQETKLLNENNQDLSETSAVGSGNETLFWPSFELRPNHLMAEQVSAQIERSGLTNEQAIEMVGMFVRSFYRYHTQEISNSIVDHYLSDNSVRDNRSSKKFTSRARKRIKLSTFANEQNLSDKETKFVKIEDQEQELRAKQILVLDSLLEAFNDALTNIPVIKTALIHATKQLDSLADAFIGQQFERWLAKGLYNSQEASHLFSLEQQQQQQRPNRVTLNSGHLTTSPGQSQTSESSANSNSQQQLLGSFVNFAQSLLSNPSWPLELHAASAQVQQPKATYLFQLDSDQLVRDIERSIDRLNSMTSYKQTFTGILSDNSWKSIEETLEELSVAIESPDFRHRLSFDCAVDQTNQLEPVSGYLNSNSNPNHNELELIVRVKLWACSKLGSVLASFVASGNVNFDAERERKYGNDEDWQQSESIRNRVARFESECSDGRQLSPDHHLVYAQSNLSGQNNKTSRDVVDCERDLESIAFDIIISELESQTGTNGNHLNAKKVQGKNRWPVFSLFSQQLAILPDLQTREGWSTGQIVDSKSHSRRIDQSKLTFSGRSSFWANFVPAHNCSRTQPIVPISLLSSDFQLANIFGASNSSLMNLNLAFSCQTGARTAYGTIKSLVSSIKQQLEAHISLWKMNKFSSQNHHSLRMANMSQSTHLDVEGNEQQQANSPQDGQSGVQNRLGGVSPTNAGIIDSQIDTSLPLLQTAGGSSTTTNHPRLDVMRARYLGIVALICGLIVSLTLASGVCVVLRRRQRHNELETKNRNENQSNSLVLSDRVAEEENSGIQETIVSAQSARCEKSDNWKGIVVASSSSHSNSATIGALNNDEEILSEQQFEIPTTGNINSCSTGAQLGQFCKMEQNLNPQSLQLNDDDDDDDAGLQQFYGNLNLSGASDSKAPPTKTPLSSHMCTMNHHDQNQSLYSSWTNSLATGGGYDQIAIEQIVPTNQVSLRSSKNSSLRQQRNRQRLPGTDMSGTMSRLDNEFAYFNTKEGEPIMMPLVMSGQHFDGTVATSGAGCLTTINGAHYGGSSSETTTLGQSSGSSSTFKKRVKISDPLGAARQQRELQQEQQQQQGIGTKQILKHQQYEEISQPQLQGYCPMHSRNAATLAFVDYPLTREQLEAGGSLISASQSNGHLVTATGATPELWSVHGGSHIDLLADSHHLVSLSGSGINCDHQNNNNNNASFHASLTAQPVYSHQNASDLVRHYQHHEH